MSKLNKEQEYIINRMPKFYDIKPDAPSTPEKVKKALAVVEAWNKYCDEKACCFKKTFDAACSDAREAIYFADPKVALQKVKALEAKYPRKGC